MLLQDDEKSSHKDAKQSSLLRKAGSKDESKQQDGNSLLQYNIQKLLAQSASREQKYINFIKEQKQKLFQATQKYADIMLQYKKQIKQFITKKQMEKNAKRFEKVHALTSKVPPNKYEKTEYTIQSEYELDCKIKFTYIIPVLNDYFKEVFPHQFYIQFTQYYPIRQNKCLQVQLNPEIDQEQRMERIKNKYSIQMYSLNMNQIIHSFMISHFHEKFNGQKIVKYYRQNQLQFMLRDKQSQLLFGYGKIDLQQFLQFSQNQQIFLQKIPIMSIGLPDQIIAFLHIQMTNLAIPKSIPKQHIHKISQPISINRQQIKFYNDKQSRMIQRINQYKNAHHNAIPSTAGKDSGDKNLLMHQKRKQLQQIQNYKQMHKQQYMDKIFGQALQQYHTEYIQIGQCKYLPFIFTNHTDRHQKIKIKLSHRLIKESSLQKNSPKLQQKQGDLQQISFQIVDSAIVTKLIKQEVIYYSTKLQNCTMDYTVQDDYVFVINGQSIAIFVKVICHTLLSINYKYQICVDLNNDFGQALYSDMMILKTYLPIPNHIFPIYTYIGEVNEIKIQIPNWTQSESSVVGKTKIANIIGNNSFIQLQCNWTFGYSVLQLRIKTMAKLQNNKQYKFYILVYDINYIVRLASYQFLLECIDKIQTQQIDLGITNTFNVKLRLPPIQESTNNNNAKTMIKLASSDYLSGSCKLKNTITNTKQFLIQRNIQYPITISYNTFASTPSTQKLIITCTDTTTWKVLKKLLLPLKKNTITYKHVYGLVCPEGKTLSFNLELNCNYKQQTTYKLYSSNYSLMTLPQDTIVLFPNQVKIIKLQFRYWEKQPSNIHDDNKIRSVILSVDDAHNVNFYLFQLQPDPNY